jgi:hypothetical protein
VTVVVGRLGTDTGKAVVVASTTCSTELAGSETVAVTWETAPAWVLEVDEVGCEPGACAAPTVVTPPSRPVATWFATELFLAILCAARTPRSSTC